MTTRGSPSRLVLLGSDVSRSLSPVLQQAALDAAGIPLSYRALNVAPADLDRMIDEIRRDGVAGNVTRPHKVAFHDACDVLSPIARRVRAVNTFWVDDGTLHGDNTDVEGFARCARDLIGDRVSGAHVLLLGAGGAAAGVLAAVEGWSGAKATVVSRSLEQSKSLAARFPGVAIADAAVAAASGRATLIVNATPTGQHDDLYPLELDAIPRDAAVIDLVYRRGETAWVRSLRERGNVARDGMAMLLEQGALSFTRWFGIEPDREAMRRSVL
jgi:shikimate dehydrogenase